MNTEGDPFVTYRRRKSRYAEEFEDIQLEDTNSDMEQTCIHSDRGKGTGEEEDRMEFEEKLTKTSTSHCDIMSNTKHAN